MIWKVVLAVGATLALVFFTIQSQVRGADDYLQTVDDVRALHELNARLDRSALEAEDGSELNYDAINVTLREMSRRQHAIEQSTSSLDDPEIHARIDAARKRLQQKEALLETFESRNSVFRNSLSYLPLAAETAARECAASPNAARVGEQLTALIAGAMCRSECDEAALAHIRASAASLKETRDLLLPEERASLELVLRHAAVFSEYSPKVSQAIDDVLAADGRPYENLFDAIQAFHERAAARAALFRVLLLLLTTALAATVTWMVFRIRTNARALGNALNDLARKKQVVEDKQAELAELNRSLEERVLERTKELSRSHEQYRLLLDSSRAIPWEMRPGSITFSYVGSQAQTALGFPASAWTEEGFLERRLRPEERARTLAQFSQPNEYDEVEFSAQDAAGQAHWFRCYMTKSEDPDGRVVRRGLLFDISTQRILEADLRASQKLEGIGRLASGIAHEINTPVQFVGDNVSFLKEAFGNITALIAKYRAIVGMTPEIRDAEEAADLSFLLDNVPDTLESSAEGLHRIATIVRSMKEFAHPDRKQKERVDLNTNIESTLTIARNEYKLVADVITDLAALPMVLCHPGEINQVVLNMIVNAAHAIGDVVSEGRRGKITVTTRVDGDDVIITIGDTGGGIAPEHHDRVFEPFFTTKEVGRGTGQGLAIARSIVIDKHHGQISFESELGVGTTFTIRLPIDVDARSAVKQAAA